jgi:hypothetical protein
MSGNWVFPDCVVFSDVGRAFVVASASGLQRDCALFAGLRIVLDIRVKYGGSIYKVYLNMRAKISCYV